MVAHCAWPLAMVAEHSVVTVLLDVNRTLPVIAGPPLCPGVTVAVNVML